MLHPDVLIILLNDLIQQAEAGNLSASEFAKLAEPLNSQLVKDLTEQHRTSILKTDENNRRLTELEQQLTELEISQRNNRELYQADLKQYEEFLELKGLSEEYDNWEWEQIEKGMEADQDG